MSRHITCIIIAAFLATCLHAQKKTLLATAFQQNKTATVTLNDGRKVKAPNSNIFLKNASLLYFQGGQAKEARMDIIASVEFDDRKYVNIENQLAFFVDSVKGNCLYCVELIDMDAFERALKNNVNYTFIDISTERMESFTNNLNTEDDFVYPLVSTYYFILDGKIIKAHDRDLYRALNKERYRMMKTALSDPAFNWTDRKCLMRLLELISK